MPKSSARRSRSSRSTSILFLLLNTLLWGAALPIVKPALETTTPFRFLFYRFALASILSIPLIIHFWPKIKKPSQSIKVILGLEMIGTTLALGLLYAGLSRTSALEASLIATTTPLFTTLGGILYLKEKQERREWLGLALAIVGSILFAIEPLLTGRNGSATFSFTGNVMVFGQNLATAAYFVLAKKYYKNLPKLFVTSISFYVGMISFLVLSFLEIGNLGLNSLNGWKLEIPQNVMSVFTSQILRDLSQPPVLLATLYMAVFGSIIGLTAYIKGQDGIEASEASLFTYLQPLVYIPLATLWLKEAVTWPMMMAMVIVGTGVWVAERRK